MQKLPMVSLRGQGGFGHSSTVKGGEETPEPKMNQGPAPWGVQVDLTAFIRTYSFGFSLGSLAWCCVAPWNDFSMRKQSVANLNLQSQHRDRTARQSVIRATSSIFWLKVHEMWKMTSIHNIGSNLMPAVVPWIAYSLCSGYIWGTYLGLHQAQASPGLVL